MGIISNLFSPQAAISDDDIRKMLMEAGVSGYGGYGTSSSGATVSPHTAMCVSAVFACVQVISQTVGQLPIVLYRRTPKGKERAVNHPLFHLVGARPNKFNHSMAFREMLTAHTCLRGNGFAFINRVGGGRIYELLPLEASAVGINRDPRTWEITYTVSQKDGINGIYGPKDIFHLMDMTLNGYSGVSRLTYARESVGLSMSTEKFGAQLFKNGAKMGGILKYGKFFKDAETGRKVAESFDDRTNGENAHRTILLEDGLEWEKITMTSEDAQFLATRQFQIPEIARFYRMPLHKIQDMSASTNNNIEQQALEFLSDTMAPWLERWCQSMNTQLLTESEQKEYYFKFDIDDLLRPDMKSRYEAYASGIASRILNPNECRDWEDLDPYPEGNVYANPAITPGQGDNNGKK